MLFAEVVQQRGGQAVAEGLGVARGIDHHRVQGVPVAVEVHARHAAGADQARVGLLQGRAAAAVGQGVEEARVEGEGQVRRQAELRLAADQAEVHRVGIKRPVVLIAGRRRFARDGGRGRRRVGVAVHRRFGRPVVVVAVVEGIDRELRGRGAVGRILPLAREDARDADEVRAAQGLVDAAVEVPARGIARPALVVVLMAVFARDIGGRAPRADGPGVDLAEGARVVVAAVGELALRPEGVGRLLGDHVDGGAQGRGRGAVHVAGADVDRDVVDQLADDVLARIDGVVAGVVQRGRRPAPPRCGRCRSRGCADRRC